LSQGPENNGIVGRNSFSPTGMAFCKIRINTNQPSDFTPRLCGNKGSNRNHTDQITVMKVGQQLCVYRFP
jgi:hypothetical protein